MRGLAAGIPSFAETKYLYSQILAGTFVLTGVDVTKLDLINLHFGLFDPQYTFAVSV